jgi:hypothetical protein
VGEKLVEGGVCAGTSSLVVTPVGAAVGCTALFFGRVLLFCKTNSDCKKAKEGRDRGIIRVSPIQRKRRTHSQALGTSSPGPGKAGR